MALPRVAAIGNLSEQVGIKLKKMDFNLGSIFFFRKPKESFHSIFLVSEANSILIVFIVVNLKCRVILFVCCKQIFFKDGWGHFLG